MRKFNKYSRLERLKLGRDGYTEIVCERFNAKPSEVNWGNRIQVIGFVLLSAASMICLIMTSMYAYFFMPEADSTFFTNLLYGFFGSPSFTVLGIMIAIMAIGKPDKVLVTIFLCIMYMFVFSINQEMGKSYEKMFFQLYKPAIDEGDEIRKRVSEAQDKVEVLRNKLDDLYKEYDIQFNKYIEGLDRYIDGMSNGDDINEKLHRDIYQKIDLTREKYLIELDKTLERFDSDSYYDALSAGRKLDTFAKLNKYLGFVFVFNVCILFLCLLSKCFDLYSKKTLKEVYFMYGYGISFIVVFVYILIDTWY